MDIDFIGYSTRTSEWRYTEWLRFNTSVLHGDWNQPIVGRELYDHRGDDGGAHDYDRWENVNVAGDKVNADVVKMMHAMLLAGFPMPTAAAVVATEV